MFTTTTRTPPPVLSTLTVGAALLLSMIPSLLPRAPFTQGVLSGVLVLVALAVLHLVGSVAGRHPRARDRKVSAPTRWMVLAGTGTAALLAAGLAQLATSARAVDLAMAGPGPAYWLAAGCWALAVIGLGVGTVRVSRRLARVTWRRTPRPLAAALLAGVVVTSAAAGGIDVLQPLRQGLSPEHVMLQDSPVGASRSFVRATEAATPQAGAKLAVQRMVADDGLERSAIIIELPTGSGWVNRVAVQAFEDQFDGDVAVVSAQYGDLPSWWSFLLDQDPAIRSAQALVHGVLEQVAALPEAERPEVYVHGESLGALAGQEAVRQVDPQQLCGVLWSGSPGGSVTGHPRERSLLNADDPVGYLSSDTALTEPVDWPTLWVPGLSYGTTVLDLAASLSPDTGHGHRYGTEQDWTLPSC